MKLWDYVFNIILMLCISFFVTFFYTKHYVNEYIQSLAYVDVPKIINTVSDDILKDVVNKKMSTSDALHKHNEILYYIDGIFGNSKEPIFVKQCFVHGGIDITDQVMEILLQKGFIKKDK